MHGLIVVTFENFVRETFGNPYFKQYREAVYKLGGIAATLPIVDRIYDDALVVAAISFVSEDTQIPLPMLLRDYGRYFMLNGLTSHRCSQILSHVNNARDLLLVMGQAHQQMQQASALLTPPLFGYEMLSQDSNEFILVYQNPRMLCPLLQGAIEGAAQKYQQDVYLVEQTCMLKGAQACRFLVHFAPPSAGAAYPVPARQQEQQELETILFKVLPMDRNYALTFPEIVQAIKERHQGDNLPPRLFAVNMLLEQLIAVGYAFSSANDGGSLATRRFWQVPRLATSQRGRSLPI